MILKSLLSILLGFLVDQFTQDTANKRTDQYGGSIENRARFALNVVKHISDAIGEDRTSIRFGPFVTGRGEQYILQMPCQAC